MRLNITHLWRLLAWGCPPFQQMCENARLRSSFSLAQYKIQTSQWWPYSPPCGKINEIIWLFFQKKRIFNPNNLQYYLLKCICNNIKKTENLMLLFSYGVPHRYSKMSCYRKFSPFLLLYRKTSKKQYLHLLGSTLFASVVKQKSCRRLLRTRWFNFLTSYHFQVLTSRPYALLFSNSYIKIVHPPVLKHCICYIKRFWLFFL